MQPVEDLLANARAALDLYSYYSHLVVLSRGQNHGKIRLIVQQDLFVQANRNVLASITNFALIHNNHRLFGRDEYRGQWHRHPVESPEHHDASVEGQKAVTLTEFLAETDTILRHRGLVG